MEQKKLFSEKQVAVSAVLGGPVPAGILFYLNYRRLGKEKEAYASMASTLLFTVLMFYTLMNIPDEIGDKIPDALVSGFYGLVVYFSFKHFLSKEVSEKITVENPKASNWAVASVIGLGMVITIVIILAFALWHPPFPGDKLNFGQQQGNAIYFNKQETTIQDVNTLGSVLLADGFFEAGGTAFVRLDTRKTEYRITIPIDKQYWNDLEVVGYLGDLKVRLQEKYQRDVTIILEHYTLSGKTERKVL